MIVLKSIDVPVWRILPAELVATPAAPAHAPEGRFHHSGQVASYASLSAEGAEVEIQRYLSDGKARMHGSHAVESRRHCRRAGQR